MKPTDAIIRITATYVCGSHLSPYWGVNRLAEPTFLHCLTGLTRDEARRIAANITQTFLAPNL